MQIERLRVCAAAALLVLGGLGGAALAQTPLGSVAGTVLDQSGAVLPGASVTLTNVGTGQVHTATTSSVGAFMFPQVPVGTYTVNIALEGFKAADYVDVVVAVGREYSLTARLELGDLAETVTVAAGSSLVTTTTPEVATTVLQEQVLNIPLANRSLINLLRLQAGVPGEPARASTAINGGRPTWTQVTLDGINIQDNFIRTNSLDFLPNRPTQDNVAEISLTTAVAGADNAGGATTVRMVTPSGTNSLRGSVYYENRDANLAANTFFNNASQLPKPELSRDVFGGRAGGPIQRDKAFFFFNYEGWRQRQEQGRNLTIPANPDFYNGVFRYVDNSGNVQAVNVLQLTGLSADPAMQAAVFSRLYDPSRVNNFDAGDSAPGRVLNTAGFRLLQRTLEQRDQYTGRVDYALSHAHRLEGVFSRYADRNDREDQDQVSLPRPLVYTESARKRIVGAWRWTASQNLHNELRGGANIAPAHFRTAIDYSAGIIFGTQLGVTNPMPTFQPQGRYTDAYQLTNTASYIRGNHQLQMGGNWQRNRIDAYNFAGRFPTVTLGFSTAAPLNVQLTSAQFPGGISVADQQRANSMLAWLAGIVSQTSQSFQVQTQTSGFVPGISEDRTLLLDNIALYLQDSWRWKPNFTVRAGLKWEYYSPVREENNLGFVPQFEGRSFEQAMLDPTTTVSFGSGGLYSKDLNNFGPTVGFAWDVTRDGRTAVRGGYSLTFVNEDTAVVGLNFFRLNDGLSTTVTRSNLFATVAGGVPLPATPTFLPVRTQADQMSLSTTGILWGVEPNLGSPHVHQVSIGIQRELRGALAVEARYVGSFGRQIWRGLDYNQIELSPEFMADFNRARSNGYLAQQAGLAWSPLFNPNVAGSVPLTLLPSLGLPLTNATVINAIQQSEVGRLADLHMTGLGTEALRRQARAMFVQNPGVYSANALVNGGFSDYNALQLELRRQFRGGMFAQVNYTFANTNTDSDGTSQNRFEARMDNNRPHLTTGRSNFHVSHVLNANAIYEFPFGQGRRWLNGGGLMDRLAGGWQVSTIVTLQSGPPFSIFSGRGTFNRVGRSDCLTISRCNTAVSTLSVKEIQKRIGVYRQPDGTIYWIDPSVIHATGRAVGPDNFTNAPGFEGQIFFNPVAGEVGNLPVMAFNAPRIFRIDLALAKRTRLAGRTNFEIRGEAFNLTNSPSFSLRDRNINSVNFGTLTAVEVASRIVQLSARFDF